MLPSTRVPAAFLTVPLPSPFAHLPSRRPPTVGRVPAAFHTSALKVRAAQPTYPHTDCAPALSVRLPAKPPSTHCGTRPGRLPAAFHMSTLKVHAAQPTHPHTDCAPALSIRPPATHLTSPAPSRATVTPPIAQTHATPCADRPHRRSLIVSPCLLAS